MEIFIKNCKNIDNAKITIEVGSLNIKYAPNGTGKSAISQAIFCSLNDKQNGTKSIQDLKPFKYRNQEDNNPDVTGVDKLTKIKVFDEKYINEYVFLQDELLKGSFDIFIRDKNYEKGIKEIDDLVEVLNNILAEDKGIDDLINDFNELSTCFGRPTKEGIHGSSSISKAFKNGNKIINIPKSLNGYKDYIQNENNYKWVKWQIDGNTYIDISENCPYCTATIKNRKEQIKLVSKEYDPKSIENVNLIVGVFQRLNLYFSEETKSVIDNFVKNIDGYSTDQVSFLLEVKDQIDRLKEKIFQVKNFSFVSLKDVEKIIEELKTHLIDINLFSHLKSENTKAKIDLVNRSIHELLNKAGELQGSINKQKLLIEKLVKENSGEINNFLKNAGYLYHVDLIEVEKGKYKLKLIHNDFIDEVSDVKTHLSFGERNAFSLVLFMYDAMKNNPDLIVLDDPISSFDKNKKYAIVDMLFKKGKCLRGKTVLLLTHDFEPIVDMVYHHTDRFDPPFAVFLENIHGEVYEKEILKSDIKTFIDINIENIKSHPNVISKLIYLRRLYEVTNEKGNGYQLISNVLHKRVIPIIKDDEVRPMTTEEIELGTKEIQEYISSYDYQTCIKLVKDDNLMKDEYNKTISNYEKLHIYRVVFDDKQEKLSSDIIQKFINESFHIENDYIYQLNPCKFQLVPQYVIDECDKYIQTI